MASVDWQKTNVPTLAKKRSHFDNEKRAISNHSNKDINRDSTNQNYYLNCEDWNDVLKKSREFIKEIDKKHQPKKKVKEDDRVNMVSLNKPCPRVITEMGKSEEFFEITNKLLESIFIGYMGMHIHLDEVHDYLDPKTNTIVTSCEHGHAWVGAYAEWEDKKGNLRQGINGKNFETKANILKLNKAMNEMCLEHFGIPYNTGDEPRNKSVEELKKESYKAVKKELVKTCK
ncbi:MAG: hypothetical protein IJ274_00205 [Lachnospiraceae bacterium]|nr:hypothetical protein [Lachnospiraceae bacterium]